jgi:flagellar basal-body rod modification protein FlgD
MAATDGITNSQAISGTVENKKPAQVNKELGKDDFLNLLVTQLKYQDPLNPLKDQEFIAQMASFSNLEQMNNLNKNIGSFITEQRYANGLLAAGMIGMEITDADGQKGIVSGVDMDDSLVLIVNDRKVPLKDVRAIHRSDTEKSVTTTQGT